MSTPHPLPESLRARARRLLVRDPMLSALLAALALLTLADPAQLRHYAGRIDRPTLAALAGLLALTQALQASGALHALAQALLARLASERAAALALVAASALLAMVLTNDVALFVMVPLTLGLCRLAGLAPARFVVFEALAVNAGSALTPIGNPQNLFLWQRAHVPFASFVWQMLPLVAFMLGALLLLTAWAFPARPLRAHAGAAPAAVDRRLLAVALVLYPAFLVAADLGHALPACAAVLAVFALVRPRLLRDLDWGLLLVFALMFVVLRTVVAQPPVQAWLTGLGLQQPQRLYLAAIAASQLVSNVPAAIALAESSTDWRVLAIGVNVGGFGLVIGSLANLIALRLAADAAAWREFHRWSLPFLGLVAAVAYAGLFA